MALIIAVAAGCAGGTGVQKAERSPATIRADIEARLPSKLDDRVGWAEDLQRALSALELDPGAPTICAVLAVVEQESSFRVDPEVANLGKLARDELFARADRLHIPEFALNAALDWKSPSGSTYGERLDRVRTERELSRLFEDFIDEVPLGKRLLADYNPVRTGGPMQVAVDFAERHVRSRRYPYEIKTSLRHEVFTRRGGLYFGTAHLLDYAAPYGDQMIWRFADFNAGRYAARNAAFQHALGIASARELALDGDLLLRGGDGSAIGETEAAARVIATTLGLDDTKIRADLARGEQGDFDRSELWVKVFALADRRHGSRLPRATMPRIRLQSPKITRQLTTEWFATRVDARYQRCLAK